MVEYSQDRRWSDRFIPEIKRIVGPYLLTPTPQYIDRNHAADLMVISARDVTIAARVRRPGFADRYPYEFTIRSHRSSGVETELSKITDGWARWMFYAHADAAEQSLERWWLIDLDAFRAQFIRYGRESVTITKKDNGDGTQFVAFDVREFRTPVLVGASHPIEQAAVA